VIENILKDAFTGIKF